jgi:hypothetical protein
MSGTGRFMCLSCGRFFSMEHPMESQKTVCPFCADLFFCDNIIPDVPPYLEGPIDVTFACEHKIQTDFVGDIQWCPVCGETVNTPIMGPKLKTWQESVIVGSNL